MAEEFILLETVTASKTFTAPRGGAYKLEVFGASGKGGDRYWEDTYYDEETGEGNAYISSGGGGGGGGAAVSEVFLNANDKIVIAIGQPGANTTVNINSTAGNNYETILVTSGANGSVGRRNKGGQGGVGGRGSGGNVENYTGGTGTNGTGGHYSYDNTGYDMHSPTVMGGQGGTCPLAGGNNGGIGNGTNGGNAYPSSQIPGKPGFVKIYQGKNTPPTISGTPASGSNLGTKTTGFNVTYTANDAEGDTVTVKEYLDNVLQRSYTATRGATNTIQCVTAANFQTVLNGAHTLKVVANDGKVDSAAYTVTFTKKVTKATITLTNPLNANAAIQVMVLAITGSLPADAKLTVLVTNNAKDSSPVWEDATADVKRGSNYIFTNKTAANGHWYNFKITVERGASDTGGNISGIGGAFE